MKGECTSNVQGIQPKSIKKEGESSEVSKAKVYLHKPGTNLDMSFEKISSQGVVILQSKNTERTSENMNEEIV